MLGFHRGSAAAAACLPAVARRLVSGVISDGREQPETKRRGRRQQVCSRLKRKRSAVAASDQRNQAALGF
jgi:hypothetical protein